jgi:hypothetical protein
MPTHTFDAAHRGIRSRPLVFALLPAASAVFIAAGAPSGARTARQPTAPVGEWRCRSYSSVTRLLLTTRFTLRSDGTYDAAGDRGRWSYDARSGRITWLEGQHTTLYSDTRLSVDKQGLPVITTTIGKRTYRCLPAR